MVNNKSKIDSSDSVNQVSKCGNLNSQIPQIRNLVSLSFSPIPTSQIIQNGLFVSCTKSSESVGQLLEKVAGEMENYFQVHKVDNLRWIFSSMRAYYSIVVGLRTYM